MKAEIAGDILGHGQDERKLLSLQSDDGRASNAPGCWRGPRATLVTVIDSLLLGAQTATALATEEKRPANSVIAIQSEKDAHLIR